MRYFFVALLALFSVASFGQSVVPIRGDTIRLYKQGGNAELKIENDTKNTKGILTNVGGGVTKFKASSTLNDSTIIVGLDTLVIRGATGGGGITNRDSISWNVVYDSLLWLKSPAEVMLKSQRFRSNDASILTITKPAGTNTDSTLDYLFTVNNDVPFYNAWKLQGIPISAGFPTNNQYLGYNSTTGLWEPKTIPPDSSAPGGVGGDLQLNDGFGGLGPSPIYSDGTSMRHGVVNYYDADYSASMTTLEHIPSIRKVNALIAAAGAGAANTNIGSHFRWLNPGTQTIRTVAAGWGQLIDSSSNTNALTFKPDTTSGKLATQWFVTDAISGLGGSGADSSLFATRYFVLNNRALNFSATAEGIVSAGDSYITGQAASTGQNFTAQVAGHVGKTDYNIGVGGTGAREAAYQINSTLPGVNNNYGLSVMFGFNDYRRNGAALKTLLKNKNAWYSILASAFLSENSVPGNSSSITKTGTWGTQDIGDPLGGKSTRIGGQAVYSQGAGNTAQWPFTGPNVSIGTIAYSGTVYNGGSFKVEITNVAGATLTDTVHTNNQTDGVSDGSDANIQTLMAKVYWDLGNNSHTITITTLDANTVYIDYIGVLNGQSNAPPVMAWLIPKMKSTSYALGSGSGTNNGSAAAFNSGDSIINLVVNEFKARNYPVVTVPANDYFDPENTANLDADLIHPNNAGYGQLTAAAMSVIEPYSYSGIPVKNSKATIQFTPDYNILFGGGLNPDVAKTYFAAGYDVAGFPMMILNSRTAPAGSRRYDWYASKTARELHGRFVNDNNTLASDWMIAYGTGHTTDSVYFGGVLKTDSLHFGGEMNQSNNFFFQAGRLPGGSQARGFELKNPAATLNQRIVQWYISEASVFSIRFRKDDNSGAGSILDIPINSNAAAGHATWHTPMKYNADYSASMTTDRYIPDIGKVNSLIAAAGTGVTTMAAIGSSPNANGATISGSTFTLQPANASFGGAVTTTTQTFAGPKTLADNATFNGTGTAITATAGAIGAILIGSSVGAVLTGGSFGLETKSATSPLLVTNTATGSGILQGLQIQRNATYTGANGDGLYIRFDAKNDAGTSKNYAVLTTYMPSAANGAEYGGFSFDVMNNGASVAAAIKVTARGLELYNGTAPTTSVTDGVRLYSEDVSSSAELKARDEAGNITTLSPHNFTGIPQGRSNQLAWAFYSEKEGKYINVDMFKLAELVEKLTGEKLIYTGSINNKPNPGNK